MPIFDVQQIIRDKVIQDFSNTGLDVDSGSFNFSQLSAKLVGLSYSPGPTAIAPLFHDQTVLENCITTPVSAPDSKSYANTTSVTIIENHII